MTKVEHKISFKTIDQQMNILESRGLVLNDRDKVAKYLLSSNYYNIVNGYSKYFQVSSESDKDQYIKGANFDEVSQLYFFDKELKQILFNSILQAEHHLKSIFAYRFAEAYQDTKYAYLNISCYDSQKRITALESISKISRLIESKIKFKDDVIMHYVRKYDDIPIWVLADFLDFGTLGLIIKSIPVSIQNKISQDLTSFIHGNILSADDGAKPINPFTPEMLNSFIKNVRETRNICAHNTQ